MHPEREVELPVSTGHIARGILLHMLKHGDPSISARLHELNVMKLYVVTPLYFRTKVKAPKGGGCLIS